MSDDIKLKAQPISVDGPEQLASLLNSLLGGITTAQPTGAQLLSQVPAVIPGDGPEDAEWRAKHLKTTHAMVDELSGLDMLKVDTLVIGFRLTNGDDGFFVGGGHMGTASAVQAMLIHLGEKLQEEIEKDYDQEAHDQRVAAGEEPCDGCGKFHN